MIYIFITLKSLSPVKWKRPDSFNRILKYWVVQIYFLTDRVACLKISERVTTFFCFRFLLPCKEAFWIHKKKC